MNNTNHEVKLIDRNILNMSGITKIESFNKDEFYLTSVMGPVHIVGENLELINLDTTSLLIKIKGTIKAIIYMDKLKKEKKESIISKLFK